MTKDERAQVAAALERAENGTNARVAVRIVPDENVDAFELAKAEFEKAGLHQHEPRNAALLLVAPKARRFAIIGDRELHQRVGDDFWGRAAGAMQPHFAKGEIAGGLVAGLDYLGGALRDHFSQ